MEITVDTLAGIQIAVVLVGTVILLLITIVGGLHEAEKKRRGEWTPTERS